MTRSIRLPIAPATEKTCGDGTGAFCPLGKHEAGTINCCLVFRPGERLRIDRLWGPLLRWPECIAAETPHE